MKMRLDFVSNSSSSSFMLLGVVISYEKFAELVSAAGWKPSEDNAEDEYWEMREWIEKKTKHFLTAEIEGDDYDIENVLVGADPHKMKDSETLGEFKQKVADSLAKVGISETAHSIDFKCGGEDSSGCSWIESRG